MCIMRLLPSIPTGAGCQFCGNGRFLKKSARGLLNPFAGGSAAFFPALAAEGAGRGRGPEGLEVRSGEAGLLFSAGPDSAGSRARFMLSAIRLRSKSTFRTVTVTCCCTFTTSAGFFTKVSAIWLTCTRPS